MLAANSQLLLLYWQLGNFILQNQDKKGWGSKIIPSLSGDLKKAYPALKGFSPRNMAYMKQFAIAYPLPVIEWLMYFERKVQEAGGFTQQVVAKLLSVDNQSDVILQQPVAKLDDSLFLQSILARVSWSHHVVLLEKVGNTA